MTIIATRQMTKILLVDDHQVILESLLLLFRSIDNVEVVGSISNALEAENFLDNNEVDLVISDYHIPNMSGLDLTLMIRKKYPNIKVLLLTMAEDATHIREAIKAGVNGYVLKKTGKEELEIAISKIMNGKKYFSDAVISELTANDADDYNNARPETIQHLTEREIEILALIANEYSSQEIADKLFISLSTVETHRRNLFQKLNVKSAVGLAKYALKHGLVH
jgi:DNA-binding NarL/FixJ family response regulator